jgi:hypothetical protein
LLIAKKYDEAIAKQLSVIAGLTRNRKTTIRGGTMKQSQHTMGLLPKAILKVNSLSEEVLI